MLIIIAMLLGLALGQHIKITVSPELQALWVSTWAQAESKVLPAAASVVKRVKAAMPSPDPAIQARLDALDA
jgi:hypothetical protein